MKRHFSFLLLLLSAMLSATAQEIHYDFCEPNQKGDTLYYVFNKYDSSEIFVVPPPKPIVTDTLYIPGKVEHNGRRHTVTEIQGAFDAINFPGPYFSMHHIFSHVVIPETIREIYNHAFCYNDSLLEVTIPSSCVRFGECVFENCPRLKWVDCSKAQFDTCRFEFWGSKKLQWILPPKTLRKSSGAFLFKDLPGLRFVLFPENVVDLEYSVLATVYPSLSETGDTAVPFVFLSQTPPKTFGGQHAFMKVFNTIVYYPCGADTAYQHSWMNKYKLKPSLFLENGYKKLDSICPAKCYRAYGFRPDSVGVWIVKKKSPDCDCDSLNIYIVRSLLPDATVNDSSINVEPNREDTSVVWTWEGTGVEYDVYREEQKIAVVTKPYYRDTDIMPGVQYCYNFVPINAYGCEGEWSGTNCYTMVFDDGIGEHTSAGTVTVRPNPATGRIFIDNLPEALQGAELVVYDATGREVLRQDYTPAGADVSALSRGIYFLRIGSLHGKFVKM